MLRSRFVSSAALAAGAVLGQGCGAGADLGIISVLIVSSVEVSPQSITLLPGQTHPFEAVARTSSGVPVTGRAISWSSSNPLVASVGSDGVVRGIAPGITRIGAQVDGTNGSAELTVSTIPVDRLELVPASNAVVIGATVQLTATVYDADGGVLTGRVLTWSTSQPLIATVSSSGLVTALGVGQVTITAEVEGKSGTASITVSPRPAARMAFLTPPADAVAGATFTPAIRVAIQDETGATVSNASGTVALALGPGAAGATLAGTVSVTAVNGVATFADLSMTKTGSAYTLIASSSGLSNVTSGAFAVRPAAATRIGITTQPPATAASASPLIPPPVVQVIDQFANPVAQGGVEITATLASGTGTLSGAAATTSPSGTASFSALAITGVPGPYSLAFSTPGLAPVTSTTITLTAGNTAGLVFTAAPPTSATSGVAFGSAVTVALRDGAGNPLSQAGVAITAAIASGAGTLSGPPLTTTTDGTGAASFAGLVITGPAGPYTLVFSGAGINPLTSAPIQLAAAGAGPTHITFTVSPPATATNGQALDPRPALQLRDASGNVVRSPGVQMTASAAGLTLTGGTASTNGNGLATFSGLSLVGIAGNYTLVFTAAGVPGTASSPIALVAGPPARIAVTGQPATAVNGQNLASAPVVQVQDIGGNDVAQSGLVVSVAIVSGPGGTLSGTQTASTNSSGAATFPDLRITGPVGDYALRFSASGLLPATSGPITLTAGAPTRMAFATAPPSSAPSGLPLSPQPVVQLEDISGNASPVAGVSITVTLPAAAGASLKGTSTATTDAAGKAAFTDLELSGPTGDYILVFTGGGLPDLLSAPIRLETGAPAVITLTTQPASAATNGVVLSPQPVVVVRDGGGNALAGATVTATIASGPPGTPALGGTVAVTTNATGTASFTNLELIGPAGVYTLRFTAGAASVTSGSITLQAGSAVRLSIMVQPPANAILLVPFVPSPQVELQDSGGNRVSSSGIPVTAAVSQGNGSLGGVTTVNTFNGVATFLLLLFNGGSGSQVITFSSPDLASATARATQL